MNFTVGGWENTHRCFCGPTRPLVKETWSQLHLSPGLQLENHPFRSHGSSVSSDPHPTWKIWHPIFPSAKDPRQWCGSSCRRISELFIIWTVWWCCRVPPQGDLASSLPVAREPVNYSSWCPPSALQPTVSFLYKSNNTSSPSTHLACGQSAMATDS